MNSDEPLYGAHYLPRKFKIGIAHPTDNSVDVLTQDVAFVPVANGGRADGSLWDFYSGGGLGMTHNKPSTAPLLALHLGRIRREQVVEAARAIAILQKENGERKDRRQARWKYTIRRLGVEAVRAELKSRFRLELENAAPAPAAADAAPPGLARAGRGQELVRDLRRERAAHAGAAARRARAPSRARACAVRLTAQQDLLLCDVTDRAALEAILDAGGVARPESVSLVRRNAMACPAKPTCGLAMTEAERILPSWIDGIEAAGLGDVDVVIRMTGCPNMCARPPTAEIGIFGYGKNDHVVLVGGSREGTRLAHELYARLPGERMVEVLVGLLRAIRTRNPEGLPAGELLHRTPPERLREWVGVADS